MSKQEKDTYFWAHQNKTNVNYTTKLKLKHPFAWWRW